MFVFYDWRFPHVYLANNAAYFLFNSCLSFQRLCRLLWGYCLWTEKRLSYVYTLVHDIVCKHVLSVVVLSLTPLNDLRTSPETRARSIQSSIFYRFRDIAGYQSKVADFDPPHLHSATIGGDPGRISRRSLASENQSPWAIVWRCLCDPLFSRFSRTPTCDGQTDRQTDRRTRGHGQYRGCIASRGYNQKEESLIKCTYCTSTAMELTESKQKTRLTECRLQTTN